MLTAVPDPPDPPDEDTYRVIVEVRGFWRLFTFVKCLTTALRGYQDDVYIRFERIPSPPGSGGHTPPYDPPSAA